MIYGDLKHFRGPFVENAVFGDAMNFILNDAAGLEDGRYDLPDGMFALLTHYTTQPAAKRRYETHLAHIDFHVVLEGDEVLYCHPLVESMTVLEDNLEENDVRFHADPPPGLESMLHLRPGLFAFVAPTDAHKTECRAYEAHARKCVIKVPADMLKI